MQIFVLVLSCSRSGYGLLLHWMSANQSSLSHRMESPSLTRWSPRPPSFTGWSPRPPSLPHRMEYTATLSYMMEKANPYHRMSVHQGRAAMPPSTRCLASHELSCLLAQGRMSAYNYPLAQLAQDVSPSTQHALLSSQDWPRSSQDWPRSSHQNELCPCWV